MCESKISTILFSRYIICSLVAALSFIQLSHEFPVLGSNSPLYGPQDFVYMLNSTTIKQQIFLSDRTWLVEFFSNWCGHCINFAPKWKAFAEDLKEWRSLAVVAGIDCAEEYNIQACRDFEIMGYPTLKIFPKNTPGLVTDSEGKKVLNIGEVFQRPESMPKLKSNFIETLESIYPDVLESINVSLTNHLISPEQYWLSPQFSNSPPFLLLVYESKKSCVGREVALRLSRYPKKVRVLRFHRKNPMYDYLKLNSWPAVGYISKGAASGSLILGKNQNLVDLLVKAVLTLNDIHQIEEKPEVAGGGTSHVENSAFPISDHSIALSSKDTVSIEDLIHTVRNLLRNEVGLHSTIHGSKLIALKKFTSVLSQYFPTDRKEFKMFLTQLCDWIRAQSKIENQDFLDKITQLEEEFDPWNIDLNVWYDCHGTINGRRGYTCGLWRLFHTLTVKALDKNEDCKILLAIAGYVKEFFGCQECSEHFSSMVERDNALELRSIREQTLWLWKAHNEVNLRLKGSLTEDPGFPKGNYPDTKHCKKCYKSPDSFDKAKVEEYLLQIYLNPKRYTDPKNSTFSRHHHISDKSKTSRAFFGGFFSMTDVGLLMFIYLSIALLLVFVCIHFKFKFRRKCDIVIYFRRYWAKYH